MEFDEACKEFVKMYGLPCADRPTTAAVSNVKQRLKDFKKVLVEELDEVDDIIALIYSGSDEMTVLTEIADLLGDVQVYAGTEMVKFGLPIVLVLNAIMQSNFSKLGPGGKPILDGRNKVLKGPNFFPPEPRIRAILEEMSKE